MDKIFKRKPEPLFPVASQVKTDEIINEVLDQLVVLLRSHDSDNILWSDREQETAQTLCGILSTMQGSLMGYKDMDI